MVKQKQVKKIDAKIMWFYFFQNYMQNKDMGMWTLMRHHNSWQPSTHPWEVKIPEDAFCIEDESGHLSEENWPHVSTAGML